MTYQEVRATIGMPAGNYGLGPQQVFCNEIVFVDYITETGDGRAWLAQETFAFVVFDNELKVMDCALLSVPDEHFVDKLRRWFRLPWW
ncbi:MAG: hypothetical protein HY040_06610 [Planctomycetes bacterium]|nr:hypothetical protein [Planctomycetota bacterium]